MYFNGTTLVTFEAGDRKISRSSQCTETGFAKECALAIERQNRSFLNETKLPGYRQVLPADLTNQNARHKKRSTMAFFFGVGLLISWSSYGNKLVFIKIMHKQIFYLP